MKLNIEKTLPKNILIGPYNVNVAPLRQHLIDKRQDCYTKLLYMFDERLRKQVDHILIDYDIISDKLNEEPPSIELLFEYQEWMETIPLTVNDFDTIMQKLKIEYEILDQFFWNLSDDHFEMKWKCIGYPRTIKLLVAFFFHSIKACR